VSWGKNPKPLVYLTKIKEKQMAKYFVVGFRKITSTEETEEFKNKFVGHNYRNLKDAKLCCF
jgi:hypothetical protein